MSTPTDNLQVGEVGLPHLVQRGCLVGALFGRVDHDEGRVDNQVMRFEESSQYCV